MQPMQCPNRSHWAPDCRQEQKQEGDEADRFEAASKAKAQIRSWKRPHLTPGHSPLPTELWGIVLEQMLTPDSLWDLRATVRDLCHLSTTCKDLALAVQRQGWPKLNLLLEPVKAPELNQVRGDFGARTGRLPANPDALVQDPASLKVAELREACKYLGELSSGEHCRLSLPVTIKLGNDQNWRL